MAFLRFSTPLAAIQTGSVSGLTITNVSQTSLVTTSTYRRIKIMQGTIPTQTELDSATDANSFRSADVLISLTPADGYITSNNETISWAFQQTTASATGVASWFIWHGRLSTVNNVYPMTAVVGSITLPGGGGDMSLVDLNIVSGQVYDFGPADFSVKRDYNF